MNTSVLTRRLRRARRGMTLIEIIVVIVIISMLMAAVGVAVIPKLNEAKVDTAKIDIRNIQTALKMYYAKKGSYPESGNIKALVDSNALEKAPIDPWGHEYVYLLEGGKPVIKSLGADGTSGGSDLDADISSADLK